MTKLRVLRVCLAGLMMLSGCFGASAEQPWPSRPVHIVVPYAPGGAIDILARELSDTLATSLGTPFVVENRTGAAGIIGTQYVANQAADGYTVLFTTVSHTLAPSLRKLSFNPEDDFVGIIHVADSPMVLIRNPSLPAPTLGDLIRMAKSKPGRLRYGHGGVGSPSNISMELLKSLTGMDILGIPYRGAAPVAMAVTANTIELGMVSLPPVVPLLNSGQVEALGVSTPQRGKLLPNVPTFVEAGVSGYNFNAWVGLVARKGTPEVIVAKLAAAADKALRSPKLLAAFSKQGFDIVGGTPEDFDKMLADEFARWPALLKNAGIVKKD